MTNFLEGDYRALIGGDNANNRASTSSVVGNLDGSVLERLEVLQSGLPGSYDPFLGFKVSKTENVNTATGVDLFTVTGKVLVTVWSLEVTNALHTTVTDYKLRIKTDNVDLCAAGDISSAAVGFMMQLNSDAGDTILASGSYAVSAVKTADTNGKGPAMRIIGLAGGSCTLQSNRTAGASGDEIIHTLWYRPLEASATVVAA